MEQQCVKKGTIKVGKDCSSRSRWTSWIQEAVDDDGPAQEKEEIVLACIRMQIDQETG